jgi:CHRD domain-containing protein/PEP-CTERM motif-containing protein
MKNCLLRFISGAALCVLATQASAAILTYDATLSGASEAPPNASPGTGFAEVIIDNIANTMRVEVTFSGLLGTTAASYIHCCTASPGTGTAGVATTTPTFAGFPLGVTSGTYDNTLDMTMSSSYNPVYITANGGTPLSAFAALLDGLNHDEAYLNIHSSVFPGGEIRGFLLALPAVPEPSTWAMMILGFAGVGFMTYRRRKVAPIAA